MMRRRATRRANANRLPRAANKDRGSPFQRWWAIVGKEFLQLRRDRMTFGMIVGIPIIQLVLFGYAINTDPKHLPTARDRRRPQRVHAQLRRGDEEQRLLRASSTSCPTRRRPTRRSRAATCSSSSTIPGRLHAPAAARRAPGAADRGRCHRPGGHRRRARGAAQLAARGRAQGPHRPAGAAAPARRRRSRCACTGSTTPRAITQYNIVPGLMGVILTMTMVMMTGARDHPRARARHDGEPARHAGAAARGDDRQDRALHRHRPASRRRSSCSPRGTCSTCRSSAASSLLYAASLLFIAANLTVGITLSSLAQNQLQAMQLTFFYFLPTILLSGFMFPFRGMPEWAQWIGSVLPLTYFMRLVRGILLKGNDWADLWPSMWPLIVFTRRDDGIAVMFYRRTLD